MKKWIEEIFGICFHDWKECEQINGSMMAMFSRKAMYRCSKCKKTRFEKY